MFRKYRTFFHLVLFLFSLLLNSCVGLFNEIELSFKSSGEAAGTENYSYSGSLDTSFGTAGFAAFDPLSSYTITRAESVLTQDDRIVSAFIDGADDSKFVLVAMNSEGVIDTTFSSNGYYELSFANITFESFTTPTYDNDTNSIYVGLQTLDSSDSTYKGRLVKIDLTTEQIDTGFGTSGYVEVDLCVNSTNSSCSDPQVINISDNYVYMAINTRPPAPNNTSGTDNYISKINKQTGTLDLGFADSGHLYISLGTQSERIKGIDFYKDDILATGYLWDGSLSQHRLAIGRYSTFDGSPYPDLSGSDGIFYYENNLFVSEEKTSSSIVRGKYHYHYGYGANADSTRSPLLVKMDLSTMTLVSSFGSSGLFNTNISSDASYTQQIITTQCFDPSGNIMIAGRAVTASDTYPFIASLSSDLGEFNSDFMSSNDGRVILADGIGTSGRIICSSDGFYLLGMKNSVFGLKSYK